ncbi:excalibur calcium-binding domain-containing protein [Roseomonas sp. CAU 1739]|uniref:excalibur calcium-binding domain-containing protein n=1 Tax=Roseomonas sp. CAU 1739 TaxID=3140364 RepID=UPI00325BF2EA
MLDTMAGLPAVHLLLAGLAVGGVALLLLRPGVAARMYGMRWLIARPILAALGALGFCAVLWLLAPYVPASLKPAIHTPRSCAEARAMGFGTARIGEPGYFRHLDADGDGWSCEPMPRR